MNERRQPFQCRRGRCHRKCTIRMAYLTKDNICLGPIADRFVDRYDVDDGG